MKTKEELNALKEEVEALNKKLCELTEEELSQVTGGVGNEDTVSDSGDHSKEIHIYKNTLDEFDKPKWQ